MSTCAHLRADQGGIDELFRARAIAATSDLPADDWRVVRAIEGVYAEMTAAGQSPSAFARMQVRREMLRLAVERAHKLESDRRGQVPESFNLADEPGLMGDLARASERYAFRPVAEFAQLSALATLAPVFARRFVTPTLAGLNLYLVGLAATGVGKEALIGFPPAILHKAKLGFLVGASDFTSDSAIEVALRARPNFLAAIDEVGEFVGAAQHRAAASFTRTIRKTLLDLYGKSRPDARWTGKQKANAEHDKAADPVCSPTLTILGASTVAGFFEALTEANLADGFINRLTVVEGGAAGSPSLAASRATLPPALTDALRNAYEASKGKGNLADVSARVATNEAPMTAVPWADDVAESRWLDVFEWQMRAEDDGRGGVASRAAEQVIRIATIRALARDPGRPAVRREDVTWAWELVRTSIETIERGVRENMSGSEFETLVKAIERAVAAAGKDGLTKSYLLRAKGVSKAEPRMVDAAITRLVDTERAWWGVAAPAGGGRPAQRLRIRMPDERG